jgi:hypothetical protein
MSRRNVNFYRCDAPGCWERWHEGQRIYMEADDECLDFCSWDCAIKYGLSLEVEAIPRVDPTEAGS